MGGGGKGGSQSTKATIPAWAESAMRENLRKASAMGEIGYMPYYGPDVAAFTPLQELGMQGSYDAAAAFGLAPQGGDALAGIPQATDFGGGLRGYSSGDLFELARAEFEARNPQQAAAYNRFFVPYGQPSDGGGGGAGAGGGAGGGYGGGYGGGFLNVPPWGTPEFDQWLGSLPNNYFNAK